MVSATEAAKLLGVSVRRVTELARSGALKAQKLSGVWVIDEDSIKSRLATLKPKGGRPTAGSGKGETRLTLMNRTHEVAQLVYNSSEKRFTKVKELLDVTRAPVGLMGSNSILPLSALNEWWRSRGIPAARANVYALLRDAGVSVPEELLECNLGLSLSDHSWVRPLNSGLAWEHVNFFNNEIELVREQLRPFDLGKRGALAHPNNTSDGNLAKTWEIRNGKRVLVKGGSTLCQEPLNEAVATELHKRLLSHSDYVAYEVERTDEGFVSACSNFLADDEEYVPAFYVARSLDEGVFADSYRHYVACAERLGAAAVEDSLAHMIVCDDIIANSDRHFRNFGLVRNVETLECRTAPIFDSGASLWHDVPFERLAAGEHSFESKQFFANPARQLLLVEDMSWVKLDRLEGFVDKAMQILSQSRDLEPRLPYIRAALEWRIKRISDIVEWE